MKTELANNLLRAASAMFDSVLADLAKDDQETYQAVTDLASQGAMFRTFVTVSAAGLREVGIDVVSADGEVSNLMMVADRALDS